MELGMHEHLLFFNSIFVQTQGAMLNDLFKEGIMTYDKTTLLEIYRRMVRIRDFEYRGIAINDEGVMGGSIHTYIGEEAIGATIGTLLRKDDYVSSTHRGHGHILGKGSDPKRAMAELLGRSTGFCKGKGGSMHIADFDNGIIGANGIVGGGIPIGVGAGLSIKLRGKDNVSVVYFGDGASNLGSFHEAANLASVWELPVIFVCENNLYAMSGRLYEHTKEPDIYKRAVGYGMRGLKVDGNDVFAVYEAASEAIENARVGKGPTLLECKTYRWRGHWEGDRQDYRSQDEVKQWKSNSDCIKMLRDRLISDYGVTEAELDKIDAEEEMVINEAEKFARESPYPETSELLTDLFTE